MKKRNKILDKGTKRGGRRGIPELRRQLLASFPTKGKRPPKHKKVLGTEIDLI